MTQEQNEQINELYLAMYSNLFEYAFSCLRDESLAEEAIQETFRIACQKPDALWSSPNPNGWIKNVLKNVIRNMWKKQSTTNRILKAYYQQLEDSGAQSEDNLDFELLYPDVVDSEEFRIIREMTLEGKTYQELSQERGISQEACRKRVQRAREFLRKKIDN